MADEQPTTPLGDLLSEDRGISVGVMYPGDHDPLGVPLIKAGDLVGGRINSTPGFRISRAVHHQYRRTELVGGELLMTLVGDVGRCAVVPTTMKGWNAARAIAVMRFREPSDALFVKLCLQSPQIRHLMDVWSNTTVQQTLNLKEIRLLPLPWPIPAVRARIAHILGTLDDKIELNRRTNETLESMARALFQSWFVDFDPVHAKAAGKQPAGMDAETAALFPSEFVESEIGQIPKGWAVGTLADVGGNVRETIHPAQVDASLPYIGLEHMPQRSIALGAWSRASEAASQKTRFAKGDILFGKLRPYFHKVGVAATDGVCSTDIVVVRPHAHCTGVALGHLSSDTFVAFTTAGSDGTRMPRTSWARMASYSIAVPTPNTSAALDEHTGPLVGRIHANLFASRVLTATRDTLLPRLLSGELRIPDAERIVGAAT